MRFDRSIRFRLWDQFCEYTELPGFRFMTSKVTLLVRLAAIGTFAFSLLGMCAQLWYLVGQYLRTQTQTSSRKYRIQQISLPSVYLCHPLNGSYPLPLVDLCWDPVFNKGAPDLAGTEQMTRVVPFCNYQIKLIDYQCELRCKWTSQGFCIEARLNVSSGIGSSANDNNASNSTAAFGAVNGTTATGEEKEAAAAAHQLAMTEVTDYDIRLYFNFTLAPDASAANTLALALVFLRFADNAKWPTQIPLVGAAHMIMERDALNTVQVTETLRITRNDVPDTELAPANSTYEHCIWRVNSELAASNWTCPSEFITNIFAHSPANFTNVTYGMSECALQRAQAAQKRCKEDREFNRFTAKSAIFTRSAAELEGLDPTASPNLHIYPTGVLMQETLHQLRSAEWKLLSEIGGTMALYLGFTLMSLLEAFVFFSVAHVRKVARQLDEESQLARKNPPIKKFGDFARLRMLMRRIRRSRRRVEAATAATAANAGEAMTATPVFTLKTESSNMNDGTEVGDKSAITA